MMRMEVVKASRVEEFAKIWDENKELKRKLRDSQAGLHALANDYTTITAKVSVLEARAKAAEERAAQKDLSKWSYRSYNQALSLGGKSLGSGRACCPGGP